VAFRIPSIATYKTLVELKTLRDVCLVEQVTSSRSTLQISLEWIRITDKSAGHVVVGTATKKGDVKRIVESEG
jgi:hypothetical protein